MNLDGKVLKFILEFTICGVERCEKFATAEHLSATVNTDVPSWFTPEMATLDGIVREKVIIHKFGEFYCNCPFCSDSRYPTTFCPNKLSVKITDGTPEEVAYKIESEDEEEIESDGEDEDEIEIEFKRILLRDSFTFHHDSHWNCYCKKMEICGCGCDKLHDGWV